MGLLIDFNVRSVKRRDKEVKHLEGTEGEGITIFLDFLKVNIFSVSSVVIFSQYVQIK